MSTEETLFAQAVKLPIAERETFVRDASAGDVAIQRRLMNLLSAHESENVFLDLADTHSIGKIPDVSEGDQIGPYRLLQEIGEGGFGVVYMAQQQHPIERKVAIKIIKPGMDSRAVIARFEAERQALAMMDHPNIARVFDGGASDDGQRPYFVMELVQGVPITEFCDTNSYSTRERLKLFISVCNAVHHAHQKGIIHRDIKPSNVMVTLHDGQPVVKVIDFGVAKALHQRLTAKTLYTQFGAMVGTPQYMSPEQAETTGLDVDIRSDIYSLSVLLYELMTGTTPLETEKLQTAGLQKLQQMICEDEAQRPSLRLSIAGENLTTLAQHRSVSPERLPRELKGDLDWIILKGLEKDRSRRYESAKDLAADIQRALNHQPVTASPPSFAYRTKKFARRNRVQLALAAAAMGVVAALLLGLINHQRQRLAALQKDETRLNDAIDVANSAMVAAVENSHSNELWTTAELRNAQIEKLVDESTVGQSTITRALSFMEQFDTASQDRQFAFSMEELLVNHSTKQSVDGLRSMKIGFHQILKNRGYNMDSMPPDEVATRLQKDHAPIKLTDAIELWLATRMKLDDAGIQEIEADETREWIEAMTVADPHPLRAAIRSTIFQTVKPNRALLDAAVDASDLSEMCARKLSWLAQAYDQVGDLERSIEVRDYALTHHSNDLMLNFEHATRLMDEERFDEAIRYLMRCTSIRPGNAGVWKKLAEALGQNNELQQAQKAIKTAIELNPKDAVSHLQLAKWQLQATQPTQAIQSAEVALGLDKNLHEIYRVLGCANMELEKYPQALVAFEEFQNRVGEEESSSVTDLVIECQKMIGSGR
jgi:serine/threonine protein kinase/Flp pilus assembly protein TadD